MADEKQLADIAAILRRDALKMTSAAGSGHPTSCMSCAEVMSTLFFREMSYDTKDPFNPDNDEFILSKGHAAPILYASLYMAGCIRDDIMSLRKISSPLEGHPMPSSLKWVKVATGSLGQGLSVGVGMALAAKMQSRKCRTYVLMGDGESAEGSVYEALQIAAYYKLNNLCAIVDVNRLGQSGETMPGHDADYYAKRFGSFGWETIVIDGHDVKSIIQALNKSKSSSMPAAIIAKTMKGKGVSFLENKDGWHGKALDKASLDKALAELPDPNMPYVAIKKPAKSGAEMKAAGKITGPSYAMGAEVATRKAYGAALAKLAKADTSVIAVDAEVSNSTYAEEVKKSSPSQFIEAYIAEQNMAGMALGLSVKGFNVFGSTFASFLCRAHDQIRMAALSSASMTFCGSHCGVSIGEDGASQMGLDDIAMFRALPDSIIFYPSDAVSAEKLTFLAAQSSGIKYIRTTRPATPVIYGNSEGFLLGGFKAVKESRKDKVVLAGAGITLHEALKAHYDLKKAGMDAAVVDLYCIKPFDSKKFAAFVKKHGNGIVVCEDHYAAGGIGEMMASALNGTGIKIEALAVKIMPHSGKKDEILDKCGISSAHIVKAARRLLE
ncbi:MAG TPA: transketolase [archaeon]|nr:transketolase [archaeon]